MSGREQVNHGWFYVTKRNTELGMKAFNLPPMSRTSITARLSFNYKFYGYTSCSLLVSVGRNLKLKERRRNTRDSGWRSAPNVDFCCCPRCPTIFFKAVCKFGKGGVAVDDIVVSVVRIHQPLSRSKTLTTQKSMTASAPINQRASTAAGTTSTNGSTTLPSTLRMIPQTEVSTQPKYHSQTHDTFDTMAGTFETSTSCTTNGSTYGTSSELPTQTRQSNTFLKVVRTWAPGEPKHPQKLKVILPLVSLGILVIVAGLVGMCVRMQMKGRKEIPSHVNTTVSFRARGKGLGNMDFRQEHHHLDTRLETSGQENGDHHYIPMNPIRSTEPSPNGSRDPVVIYESATDETEKRHITKKHEPTYRNLTNREQRPHLYANCLQSSDCEGTTQTNWFDSCGCTLKNDKLHTISCSENEIFEEDSFVRHGHYIPMDMQSNSFSGRECWDRWDHYYIPKRAPFTVI
ncbi:uncharacterized protein LOC121421714 [Lytechinus variegatus]|uniref:uncharacterized protein LOC121421714 n=1 Tax=Lytechinus variegatus TaxID=7654 RepID=UPI001BB11276|nr:uncharacterized protein LOC121421714 [Lytechinus variegatus]